MGYQWEITLQPTLSCRKSKTTYAACGAAQFGTNHRAFHGKPVAKSWGTKDALYSDSTRLVQFGLLRTGGKTLNFSRYRYTTHVPPNISTKYCTHKNNRYVHCLSFQLGVISCVTLYFTFWLNPLRTTLCPNNLLPSTLAFIIPSFHARNNSAYNRLYPSPLLNRSSVVDIVTRLRAERSGGSKARKGKRFFSS